MSGPTRPGPAAREEVPVEELQARHGRRYGPSRPVHDRGEHVIVQVLAHTRQVRPHVDAHAAELGAVADPREHEQLRRLDRPRADDDLMRGGNRLERSVASELDARAARPLEEEPHRARSGDHGQALRARHRPQEGRRRAVADAVPDRQLGEPDAVELGAVVVVVERDARLLRCLDRPGDDGMGLIPRHHAQGAALPVVVGGAAVEVLGALEEGEHVSVAPAGVAEVGPRVVVRPVTADVDHPVQRARAAQHAAAGEMEPPPGAGRLRNRAVPPVLRAVPELPHASRIVNGRVLVRRSGLEEHHADTGVDQAPRDDGAGRAGADDRDVARVGGGHGLSAPAPRRP